MIEKVVANEPLRKKVIAQARSDVKSFSLEAMAKNTEAVYQEIMSIKRG